ncbi:ERCC4 domain-containing protein [Pseudomonas serbica]|jgi:Fanconi anemia group M protein|uniref:ERCC4 domain-containing protein n=1 Tax=Pseudomonas serbica TaxID=2965074 RepID=UPI00237BF36F|nr:ERCC4 domain-containing protein [Pseudomonas serbica]
MIEIFADMREGKSGILQALAQMPNVNLKVGALPCGDFVVGPNMVVERKEAKDFVDSIKDRRLFEQVAKCKLDYQRVIIIVEGDISKVRTEMSKEAIAGALSWLQVIEGVSLTPSSNAAQTALLVGTMARHAQEGLGYDIALRAAKPKPSRHMAEFILEGLPGVGPTNARKILDHFGSVRAACNAMPIELTKAPGIGAKTAARIHEAINWEVANETMESPAELAGSGL